MQDSIEGGIDSFIASTKVYANVKTLIQSKVRRELER